MSLTNVRCVLFCAVVTLTWTGGYGETVLGVENDDFDFDGLPGALHEFKVEVGAGKEECFYQQISAGGKMHVSFEVLRGGDQTLDFYIRKAPYISPILEARTRPRWITEFTPEEGGPYAICLDNTISMMSSKLVYVYLVTYVQEEWDKFTKEIEDVHLTVANVTALIQNVQKAVTDSLIHQAQSRMHVVKDWHAISRNNTYIGRWSIIQCVVIIASACVQVYVLRRLFRTPNVTPSSKPRA